MSTEAVKALTLASQSCSAVVTMVSVLAGSTTAEDRIDPHGVVPPDLVRFLARLRLLEGVPFNQLVADAELLPLESIRFFHLDRNWTDALVEGALSVGTVNTGDREQLAQLYPVVRTETDTAERLVRLKDADAPALDAAGRPIGQGGLITGFLLRSRVVSGFPGLHVRAYATDTRPDDQTIPDMDTSPDRLRILRLERLAPAVLLCLFDGVPRIVHIEEPRAGIQFGVRVDRDTTPGRASAVVPLRNVHKPNAGFLQSGGKARTVSVPFRASAPGVINLTRLRSRMAAVTATQMGGDVDAAEFATEALRFPFRQVFGEVAADGGGGGGGAVDAHPDAFRFTIGTTKLVSMMQATTTMKVTP